MCREDDEKRWTSGGDMAGAGQVESALLHDGLDEEKGINDGMNL